MIIETASASVIFALIKRKHYFNFDRLSIDSWYLFFFGVIIQFLLTKGFMPEYRYPLIIISYLLILLCLAKTYNRNSMKMMFIGTLLNFIVISMNNGYMPVSTKSLSLSGYDITTLVSNKLDTFHALITNETSFIILADIIPIPKPYPLPQILSIGDFFMMIGIFMFIQSIIAKRKKTA